MRNRIIALVQDNAQRAGYTFFNGFPNRISTTAMKFPALWLTPVQLVGMNGREKGSMTYKISMYMIEPNDGKNELQKEEEWEKMESSMIEMTKVIADEPNILCVRNICCVPGEFSLTGYGELSMNMTMEIEVMFCNGLNEKAI